MSEISPAAITHALKSVNAPSGEHDIVSAGMVSGITISGKKVGFIITIDAKDKAAHDALESAAKQAIMNEIPEVESVTVILTAQSTAVAENPNAKAVWNKNPIENVAKVIAVASGKGGVGKSTTAVNLARALKRAGKQVGLLDADIYGPSIPRMMNLSGQPEIKDGKMIPLLSADGIPCNSMGFLTGDTAIVWRGPKLSKAIHQLSRLTDWVHHITESSSPRVLDYLIVDMPPGTGDVHISMVQQVPLDGVVIVTTPQEVALLDARKCADMFREVKVPLLGVIENMSYFEDPSGLKHRLFGEGGGEKLAKEKNTALLGSVPLIPELGVVSDMGTVLNNSEAATLYDVIVRNMVI